MFDVWKRKLYYFLNYYWHSLIPREHKTVRYKLYILNWYLFHLVIFWWWASLQTSLSIKMSRDGTNISSINGLYLSERVNQSCKLSSLDQSDETARRAERHSPDLTLQRLCCTFPLVPAVHIKNGTWIIQWWGHALRLNFWNRNTIW